MQKEGLQSALLTTFLWQPSFVCRHFPSVPLTIVCPSWGCDREPSREKPIKTLFPWCTTHNKLAIRKKGSLKKITYARYLNLRIRTTDEQGTADAPTEEEVLSCGCKLSSVRLLRLINPAFPGIEGGIVHPKIMLLRYKTEAKEWLRFAIGSANLNAEDWEEYGELTWWCDFPLRNPAAPPSEYSPKGLRGLTCISM